MKSLKNTALTVALFLAATFVFSCTTTALVMQIDASKERGQARARKLTQTSVTVTEARESGSGAGMPAMVTRSCVVIFEGGVPLEEWDAEKQELDCLAASQK